MSHDNPSLASALKTGKLPALNCEYVCVCVYYYKVYGAIESSRIILYVVSFIATTVEEADSEDHPSSFWLAAIAKGTMDTYSANILKICSITQHASRQLATDIG